MDAPLRLVGVELYSENLQRASAFYSDVLGLPIAEHDPERFAQFGPAGAFLCIERKGLEAYPSQDKAVIFLETTSLERVISRVGQDRFVRIDWGAPRPWAVLHDPDAHNIVIVQVAVLS